MRQWMCCCFVNLLSKVFLCRELMIYNNEGNLGIMMRMPIEVKVSKSRKQFLELSILPKNERKTWKNYPKSSHDIFFSHVLFGFFLEFEFESKLQKLWLQKHFSPIVDLGQELWQNWDFLEISDTSQRKEVRVFLQKAILKWLDC